MEGRGEERRGWKGGEKMEDKEWRGKCFRPSAPKHYFYSRGTYFLSLLGKWIPSDQTYSK